MLATVPAAFLKWGIEAVLCWRPTPVHRPIYHIHGALDRLIPVRRVNPTQIVPDGGHLLPLTHGEQVNSFLAYALSDANHA